MQSAAKLQKNTVKRGRPATRGPRQHRELLDAVARKINSDGAGSVVLSEIGGPVGLSRSSLYYYCTDAADLVHQAYMSACRQLAQDLAKACDSGVREDIQIETLIRQVLRFEHEPISALNDLEFLPAEMQTDVRAASDQITQRLTQLVLAGQASGTLRPVDAATCASLILNVLSWALISLPWLERRDDAQGRARYVEAVCDILLNGVAGPNRTAARCTLRYDDLMKREINAFNRSQTAELKSEQILAAASRLFNLKGLDGVRLDDVSAEIGASKGAIYHHFKDKGDLIERCYDRAFDIYDLIMATGMEATSEALDRIVIVTHLNAQAQLDQNAPLALQPGLGKLAGAKRAELNRRARKLGDIGGGSFREGILNGSCRNLDAEYAPEIIAGYFLGLPRWTNTSGSQVEIADAVTDIAVYGLRART
ncbi:TetR family transcriptional regulator [Hyphomonas sp.]|uniref:TetR/AcrR family transcriptional regulator n=1 Tax=Hyphomonas sp. TaxID=87 RepID=UPI001DD70A02|nr:TetR family transcriptional regulator [Hyphomonas sp.]MBU4061823.1 TetR family transcriptional regulator [Alphaproteobacteria bacterium]MBU4163345.1 TetR family transcriptional regulator [Alphaproteobacteria bacterium]